MEVFFFRLVHPTPRLCEQREQLPLLVCSRSSRRGRRPVQNQIFIGGYWYVIYTRSGFRSCMGLRLRSRLGNFGKISRDFGKYSSRPGFSVYNLGKITEIWSRLIFFVYCSLNLNTVIVLLPRKQREKRTRSRISRSRRDLQWAEMDMSAWNTVQCNIQKIWSTSQGWQNCQIKRVRSW